jgi:hypothetical protein
VISLTEWFVCPLCGHQRPIASWNPTYYDDEIKIRDVRGRGKGHGSVVDSEWSAAISSSGLDLEAMAKRCLKIIKLCLDTSEVSAGDLVDEVADELVDAILEEKSDS